MVRLTARGGVFIVSKEGVSLTIAKHAANCATDGNFSYENANGKIAFLGKIDKRSINTSQTHDVALVNVDKENASFCVNEVTDPDGTRRQCNLFNGKLKELYGKQVFKCLPISKAENTAKLHMNNRKNSLIGKIASSEVHNEHGALLHNDVQFLVEGQSASFSQEGESGTAVALADADQEDRAIIVGFISGGIAKSGLTVCLSAQSSLILLSKANKLNYKLLSQTVDLRADKERTSVMQQSNIQCGQKLFFDINISNTTDLWKHALALVLIECKSLSDADITMLKTYENYLNERADHRTDIDDTTVSRHDEFPLATIKHCRQAWQKIHQHDIEKAGEDLQYVSDYLKKRSHYDLFLIFKLLSACTFLYIERNELEIAKKLIDSGLDSLEDVRHLNGFPIEIEAFLHCAYAKYCLKKYEMDKAVTKAKRALEIFQIVDDKEGSYTSATQYFFGSSLYVHALLRCGDYFSCTTQTISAEDIKEAEKYLDLINRRHPDLPPTQKTDFLRNICDLHFRKCNYSKAFDAAFIALKVAEKNALREDIKRAYHRCQVLWKHVRALQLHEPKVDSVCNITSHE